MSCFLIGIVVGALLNWILFVYLVEGIGPCDCEKILDDVEEREQ